MRVHLSGKFYYFIIPLPLSVVKWKWIWRIASSKRVEDQQKIEVFHAVLIKVYKEIKKYRRKYGGFVLLEVKSEHFSIKIKI